MLNRPQHSKAAPNYFFECGRCRRPQHVGPQQAGSKLDCPCGVTNVVPSIIHLQKLEPGTCPAFAPSQTSPPPVATASQAAYPQPVPTTPRCPFCSQPMHAGRILGDRYQLKWLYANSPTLLGIWAVGGIPIGHGGFMQFNRPHVWGWRCAGCAKIIVDERA
ncbi:PF20097 family protein [Anatilimnocola floriformis]|uniref:PF20097 family protein n=1 Tax=Anatilimnocola floriformis TaxID=2948575 RepID=UPI0020C2EE85|nr:PF20097 family protein [Anatilimnocola floriformis]